MDRAQIYDESVALNRQLSFVHLLNFAHRKKKKKKKSKMDEIVHVTNTRVHVSLIDLRSQLICSNYDHPHLSERVKPTAEVDWDGGR